MAHGLAPGMTFEKTITAREAFVATAWRLWTLLGFGACASLFCWPAMGGMFFVERGSPAVPGARGGDPDCAVVAVYWPPHPTAAIAKIAEPIRPSLCSITRPD